ncbi:hypothetical protein SFC66_04320 [Terribacillus saccharophilus]|uniref:hypothetical protein n=1 Tax=Terribacillus saccharophilus TaxID=361277 RepID=UPI003981CB97
MAEIKVSYIQGLIVVTQELTDKTGYEFSEIGEALKKHYPKINPNQISGLINKMADAEVFERFKEDGKRICYIYSETKAKAAIVAKNPLKKHTAKITKELTLKENLSEILENAYFEMENLPTSILKNEEDFKLLQDIKKSQSNMIDNLKHL